MSIYSKYEEIYPPDLHRFVDVTDNTYSAPQLRSMERKLLTELDYRVSPPTANIFLRRFAAFTAADERTRVMAEYALHLSLLEYKYAFVAQHTLAAAALTLARATHEPIGLEEPWVSEMGNPT